MFQKSSRIKIKGFVSIAGAGPGDPKLLTLKAKEALRAADVVVYDYLVHPSILKHAPDAEQIYVGKKGGDSNSTSQKSIESLIAKLARQGKRIVRLKGGDPFVFGRGGEEALWLARHRVPFEIIPGVTAGVAAPAYAGIPVTHRRLASEVTLITAHEDPSKKESDINWKALAQLKGTLVLYMGVRTLPKTVQLLMQYGRKPNVPVSVIRWGTTGEQKTVTGTLRTIVENVQKAKLTAPALTVIGDVNRLRSKLRWFEQKPLFGKTVLVTRSRKQASQLAEALENQGARVIELPTIEIEPILDFRVLDQAIEK
ncbi:MAG: uroporphyrinogen-III C-methyltransferase, partial [Candidatus Omnitrophica bacterium]|nr:uroporphyrinogen-III C-methyltransferase [Candidatus Omnitrophota bacterium]